MIPCPAWEPALPALAAECELDLIGAAPASPTPDAPRYRDWAEVGFAGEMTYMREPTRAAMRADVRVQADWVRSVICAGVLYNAPAPYSTQFDSEEIGWISRYAWGGDYHDVLREKLQRLAALLTQHLAREFRWKACVDTYPLLERSWARAAGLGWIGKNTCLIHQGKGSWFFLGELLTSLEPVQQPEPAADRCGTCRRCIDACPTQALVPVADGTWRLDSRRCISYLTIELRGPIPEQLRPGIGRHVFGCDICQDVCPWNRKAPATPESAFQARNFAPPLEKLAALSEHEFKEMFRDTPVTRARYEGFLRNVAVAMGNAGLPRYREPLRRLAASGHPLVTVHARWALDRLGAAESSRPGDILAVRRDSE
jgi:epoxyqueuosine reductase